MNKAFVFLIVVAGLFYLTTLREGHNWGGDFSHYIQHAENIVSGSDYSETGYLFTPALPEQGPKAYPPVFPLLLSPILIVFGLNFTAMKIMTVLFFLAALFMIFKVFNEQLKNKHSVLLLAILAFNPYFWDFKDNVLSDIPFLFFLYLAISSIHKIYLSDFFHQHRFIKAAALSFLFYLCYATRSVGIVLIPSLLVYDWLIVKRRSLLSVVTTLIFFLMMFLQKSLLGGQSNYSEQLGFSVSGLFMNVLYYLKTPLVLWSNGYSSILQVVLFMIVGFAALAGFYTILKSKRASFCEVFFLLYIAVIVIWPSRVGMRLLIPIVPLYLHYAFVGYEAVSVNYLKDKAKVVLVLLCLFIFTAYAGKYTTLSWKTIESGIHQKTSRDLFSFIKKNTDEGGNFIFYKPRVLALFTNRKASVYHKFNNDKELWKYFQSIEATYLLTHPHDEDYYRDFIIRHKDNLQVVYSNPDFILYRKE